jgi:hypothetical protein
VASLNRFLDLKLESSPSPTKIAKRIESSGIHSRNRPSTRLSRRLLDLLLVGLCYYQVSALTIIIQNITMATQKIDIPGITDEFKDMLSTMRENNLSAMDPIATMEKCEKENAKVSKICLFTSFWGTINT